MNCCCALLLGVSLAVGQMPVNDNLKVLEPMIGEWEGVFTIAEIPEGGELPGGLKEGDQVPMLLTYTPMRNGQSIASYVALVIDGTEVPMINGMIMWCPKSKNIIAADTGGDGGVTQYVFKNEGNHYVWEATTTGVDGTSGSARFKWTIDGNKMDWQIVDRFHDGKKLRESKEYSFTRVDTTSTREEFEEYCNVIEGRWVGNIALGSDVPGIGTRGDKLTAHGDVRPDDDGQMLRGKAYVGDGTVSWLVMYDAGARQIKDYNVTSGGATWVGTIWKGDGKWCYRSIGSHADGTRTTGDLTLEVSDDGSTHTWSGTTTIEGKGADKLHEVYHRVSK